MMLPIGQLPPAAARRVRAVWTDIDDTMTRRGKLDEVAYAALWRLKEAGIPVILVTGRPAGWCDAMARQWPVEAVVGENGAFVFYEVDGALRRMTHPAATEQAPRFAPILADILAEVPGSRVAQDQPYRLYDLAIDFAEEMPRLDHAAARHIRAIFTRHGAHAKISSIHVNGWFGDYDKLSMATLYAAHVWRLDLAAERDAFIYCGDSPNDEPMFEFFPNACGVANIGEFVSDLRHLPRYVSAGMGGCGFAEIVETLLTQRLK